jgi:acetoin utilization deacetylase AcuC-like enzyme
MVLHYPRGVDLAEFGIEIPVAADRVGQVLDALMAVPGLSAQPGAWLIGPDGSTITREDLLRVHARDYVERGFGAGVDSLMLEVFELMNDDGSYHRYDPQSALRPLAELFADWIHWMSGTYQCGREALRHGFCYYLGGGAHHAHYDFGHGFCIFNDIVTAIRKLQAEALIKTAWVIDVDAHKGDGTAALTANDPTIATLSVHMARGWPLDLPATDRHGRPAPWLVPSTIDVPVAAGEDDKYLPKLREALTILDTMPSPDIVYVVDGADPYEHDQLPSTEDLRLSLPVLLERDQMIHEFLLSRGLPQAWLMSGGYGDRAWEPFAAFLKVVLAGE